MTIQQANNYITNKLKIIYSETESANISDWLIENLTGARKTDRLIQKNKLLEPRQVEQIEDYIGRLLKHEPVQYVLHESWFCGLKFYVDKNVLIPRPETEELVEWIITDCKFPIEKLSILDIGSGSGCIPIALKRRLGKAAVSGCDISAAAIKVATRNAVTLRVDVNFTELDFVNKQTWDKLPIVDIIVSNPPYIPAKDKENMQRNVLDHEPYTALFVPDNDPLVFYSAIAEFGKTHLHTNGMIYVEINESLGEETASLFQSKGYNTVLKKDMQEKDRMIKALL